MSGRAELPSGLVTFMFTDIEGSTRLARMLGDDYGQVLNAHRELLRSVLRSFGGLDLFTEGDSFFVVFANAAAAIAAGVQTQRQLSAHDWPVPGVAPKVRIGMHTGWATPVAGEYASVEVHRAARVSAAAHGGQILCSGATAAAVQSRDEVADRHRPRLAAAARAGTGTVTKKRIQTGVELVDLGIGLVDLGLHRLRGLDDDERLFQVAAPGVERDFPRPRTPGAARHNLPAPLTSFVGRSEEIAELSTLLAGNRIVTIVDAGGTGKTRLSYVVAEQLRTAYPYGAWTIDAVDAAPRLSSALAAALGLRTEPGRPPLDTVVDTCTDRCMLLLVQTCEAAPAHCAQLVRRLLAGCPNVDVLVTGRQPLGVHGEVVWRIPPMQPAEVFTLLNARTTAARGGRPGPDSDGADLPRVASLLEGSPLAAELAASRLRLLSADQLAARLNDPIAALDPAGAELATRDGLTDRHDSLTASVAWSYRTLNEPAAELLRRLAVFAAPTDLSTVQWCGPDGGLEALSELTDKSLVQVVPGPRFAVTEQVRAYAVRQLAASGDERAARDRQVAWALRTLDRVTVDPDGHPRTVSLTELAPTVGEWQAALRWSAAEGDPRAGLRLARALDPWWREHDGARTGGALLHRLYDRLDGPEDRAVAQAYLVHAGLAETATERAHFLARAAAVAAAVGDPGLALHAQVGQRITLLEERRYAEAEQLCRAVAARAEQVGTAAAALPAVVTLAELLWRRDAVAEAAELLGGARQLEAGCPEGRGRRSVDWLLGMVALRRRDLVAAHDHLVVALRSRLRHGFRGAAAQAVAAFAARCALGGDPVTAAVLFGGAEANWSPGIGGFAGAAAARSPYAGLFGGFWSAQQVLLRTSLGDAAFDAAYADGVALGFDRIVALALAVEHPDLADGAARFAQTMG